MNGKPFLTEVVSNNLLNYQGKNSFMVYLNETFKKVADTNYVP